MSMMGLAASPGTAVLPTWWIPPTARAASISASASRSTRNLPGQRGSYGTIRTGSWSASAAPSGAIESTRGGDAGAAVERGLLAPEVCDGRVVVHPLARDAVPVGARAQLGED